MSRHRQTVPPFLSLSRIGHIPDCCTLTAPAVETVQVPRRAWVPFAGMLTEVQPGFTTKIVEAVRFRGSVSLCRIATVISLRHD